MKTIKPITILVAFIVAFVTGCASMVAHSEGPRSDIYPGIRGDVRNMTHPRSEDSAPVLGAIDLPFSFVGDTLYLPFFDGPAAIIAAYESTPAAQARNDRRAWLVTMKISLNDADRQLHRFGAFTNRFERVISVRSYTNQFTIHGKYYQCELAAECERLTNRGFLTITTNQMFIWINTQGRQTAFGRRELPGGF